MGGLERAPQTPQRSERPGKPVALLGPQTPTLGAPRRTRGAPRISGADPARIIDAMADIDLGQIAQRHGIRLLLQFGSTVSGQVHERSDVDLGVVLDQPSIGLRQRAEMEHDLQSLFPGRKIDLAMLNHADPLFLKQVIDHCRLLYGDEAELRRLKLYAFKRYQDHRRYLDLERRFVAEALAVTPTRG